MGEIRNSWQIAQEKASRLEDLSQEELTEQRENRCKEIAKSLVERFLTQGNADLMVAAIDKVDIKDREIVRNIFINDLVSYIDPEQSIHFEMINKAIQNLTDDPSILTFFEQAGVIIGECEDKIESEEKDIDKEGKELIRSIGITGTAIGKMHYRARDEWQRRLAAIMEPYRERLEHLKQRLYKEIT